MSEMLKLGPLLFSSKVKMASAAKAHPRIPHPMPTTQPPNFCSEGINMLPLEWRHRHFLVLVVVPPDFSENSKVTVLVLPRVRARQFGHHGLGSFGLTEAMSLGFGGVLRWGGYHAEASSKVFFPFHMFMCGRFAMRIEPTPI